MRIFGRLKYLLPFYRRAFERDMKEELEPVAARSKGRGVS
jgi:hypothetical protein